MKTKVSFIIPCYNSSKYIGKTLKSISEQTYRNFEVILIDDGSTDNTSDIAREYCEKYKLNYNIIIQKNSGVSSARNKGISNAKGDYIYFLDSDDTINNMFLEYMMNKIEYENLDMVFCGFDFVDEAENVTMKYNKKYKYLKKIECGEQVVKLMLREKIWICIGGAIYKKSLIDKYSISYESSCHNGEDQEFIYKYLIHCEKVNSVKKELIYYYQRSDSMVHSVSLKKFTVLGAIKRTSKYFKKNNVNEQIISYLENNRFQKEFIRNMLSMIHIAHKDETMLKIIHNKEFNKIIKNFKINTLRGCGPLSIKECAFIIKIITYVKFPYIYNHKIKNYKIKENHN